MKKKELPTKLNKETQTYPLRSSPTITPEYEEPLQSESSPRPSSQPSISTSSQEREESFPEELLSATSVTSFIPRKSIALDLHITTASVSSMPPSVTSIPFSDSVSKQSSSSFIPWIPKPPRFTITASSSFIPMTLNPATSNFSKTSYLKSSLDVPSDPLQKTSPSFASTASSPIQIRPEAKKTTFSEPSPREPSPSVVASQSYQDSLKFFGEFASPPASLAPQRPTKSSLKTRFFQHQNQDKSSVTPSTLQKPGGTSRQITYPSRDARVRQSEESNYSALSTTRRHSNPFMTPHTIRRPTNVTQPRSVSQALSEMSRTASMRTRFITPIPEEGEGVKAVPWCKGCKCFFGCCRNCSMYDPVCNVPCCFPYIQIFWICTLIFGFFTIYVTLVAIWGENALPGGEIFQFYTLAVCAYFAGWILACLNIPPSIGMFATGIIFGNLGWFQTRSPISATTRAIVVAFILLRAGLNTEASIFKTRGGLISRMAFVPGISEMLVASMFGFFMIGLPWFWAILFGCVVAALSPLAIIYSLVRLRETGYGEDKGITSVLLMMYALDNITLVILFGIFFTITFDINIADSRQIGFLILQTLGCICGGIGMGVAMGIFMTFFPHRYDPYCGVWRTILLSCSGLGTILLTHILNWDGAGYLCTIVMAFTASMGWKALGTPNCANPVNMVFAMGWHILQPIALGLIGAEVNIFDLEGHTVRSAMIIIPCCMMQTRFSMTFLMSGMAGFNKKERLFMALLALTKGTPQAALAPMTMDLALGRNQRHFAKHLLHVCVLEVLVTLPLGPLVASFLGTTLLGKPEPSDTGSGSTYLPQRSSWESDLPPTRQRYKSVVSRMNTENEFMLFTETSAADSESIV